MLSLPCPVREMARKHPRKIALIGPGRELPYAQFDDCVARAEEGLRRFGIAPGERVGLLAFNSIEYVIGIMSLLRLQACACPLSTRIPTATIEEHLDRMRCRVLLTDGGARFEGTECLPLLSLAGSTAAATDVAPASAARPSAAISFSRDRDATIIWTSGSGGYPKAVLHTFGNHYYSAAGSNENIPVSSADRWLLSLPLYHVGGLAILFRCMLAGAAAVLTERRACLSESLERHHVTHVSLVPTQLSRLLNELSAAHSAPSLKAVLVGGAAVPRGLVGAAYDRGLPVHTSYGSTEMASQITTTPPGGDGVSLQSAGRLLSHRELRLADDGEILVRGPTLCRGYVDGERTLPVVNSEGWFPSGDTGSVDADGYLTIHGRQDWRFTSGGENIHPEEIVRALCDLDDVAKAVVVPVDDAEFGQRPVAFLRMSRGRPLDSAQIAAALEKVLPRFKIPIAFNPWPDGREPDAMKPQRQTFVERARQLKL